MRRKSGFTIVELVIVIAVIAILAAVLIPTFSTVIRSARRSQDTEAVSVMNRSLASDEILHGKPAEQEMKALLIADGTDIPCTPKDGGCAFYWIPSANRVVQYEKESGKVLFPEELTEQRYADDWVDLSAASADPVLPPVTPTDPETPDAPTPSDFTLTSGADFNSRIKPLSPTAVVFGTRTDNAAHAQGDPIDLSSDGGIQAYKDGSTVYVLSDGGIAASGDLSGMFAGMTGLVSADLRLFSTADAVNMANMFGGCSKLEHIYVGGGWTVENVTSSNGMFRDCVKLHNYNTPGVLDFLASLFGYDTAAVSQDKTCAHIGPDGYLE